MPHTLAERWSRFWQRQFTSPPTPAQTRFDLAFGAVLPGVFLGIDPGLINDSFVGSIVGGWSLAVGFLCTISIVALAAWSFGGRNIPALGPLFAGVLGMGSVLAFGLGIRMLPITLVIIRALVGVLGFVPFVTAFVHLRCAVRALQPVASRPGAARRVALAGVVALGVPASAVCYQTAVDRAIVGAVSEIASPDPDASSAAVHRMQQWRLLIPDAEIARLARSGAAAGGSREDYERGFALITGKPMTDRQRGGSD